MQPTNTGAKWTPEEDELLIAAFEKGSSIKALAESHQRTVVAIESRLDRMGLLDDE